MVYEPPAPSSSGGSGGADPGDFRVESADQGGFAVAAEADRVVGVTNTEYGSVAPVWGTNANRAACPYNAPRLQHQVGWWGWRVWGGDCWWLWRMSCLVLCLRERCGGAVVPGLLYS